MSEERIVTVNINAARKKFEKTAKQTVRTAQAKLSRWTQQLSKRAKSTRGEAIAKIVDGGLFVTAKQRDALEKLKERLKQSNVKNA